MSPPVVGRDAWSPVCRCADLEPQRGATALVNGQAVALFRMAGDEIYALASSHPYARTGLLARGIVGRRDGVPIVGSPTHRHAFDLRTGQCLDDPGVQVATFQVRIRDGIVQVGPRSV